MGSIKTAYSVQESIRNFFVLVEKFFMKGCGVVVITFAQLHSTKPELRFCAYSNLARGVSEIRDSEDL